MSTTLPAIIKARPSAYNMINPRTITRREGWNVRFDFGEIEELAKSIKYQATEGGVPGGLLNAIRVKRAGEGFELIDGDRRLTAVELLLKWADEGNPKGYDFAEGVAAVVVEKGQDDLRSLIQMFEANSGKAFLPMEEAAAYKRMREAGMSLEQIASAVGRNHVHVNNTLALLEAPEELQKAVKEGKVGGTLAKKIATSARGNKAKQKELTEKAIKAGKDKKAQRKVKAEVEEARLVRGVQRFDDDVRIAGQEVGQHGRAVRGEHHATPSRARLRPRARRLFQRRSLLGARRRRSRAPVRAQRRGAAQPRHQSAGRRCRREALQARGRGPSEGADHAGGSRARR